MNQPYVYICLFPLELLSPSHPFKKYGIFHRHRGHANLFIIPILVYVLLKWAHYVILFLKTWNINVQSYSMSFIWFKISINFTFSETLMSFNQYWGTHAKDQLNHSRKFDFAAFSAISLPLFFLYKLISNLICHHRWTILEYHIKGIIHYVTIVFSFFQLTS